MKNIKKFFSAFAIVQLIMLSAALQAKDIVLPTPDEPFKDKITVADDKLLKAALSETKYIHSRGVEWDARLTITKGSMLLKQAKSDQVKRLKKGTVLPLAKGDVVRLYPNSEAEIRLYDKVFLHLFQKTEFQVISLEKTDTYFSLRYGSLVGKVKRFLDKTHTLKLKTRYTNSLITAADFAAAYAPKTKTTGIAVFDSGSMSVSTLNEHGLSLGLYELKNNQEIVYSAALPDFDENGKPKDDPDYKMKDIDVKAVKIDQLKELQEEQKKIRPLAAKLKKEWDKYVEGEREEIRKEIIDGGELMITSVVIKRNTVNESNDPDSRADFNDVMTNSDFSVIKK